MTENIVVTGGASGIGAAVVARLVDRDFTIWNLDLEASSLPGVSNLVCDISDRNSVEQAIVLLPDTLRAVIHVAGIALCRPDPSQVIRVNFFGLRFLNEQLNEKMVVGGQVLIVASSAGRDWRDNSDVVAGMLALTTLEQEEAWLLEHQLDWQQDPYKISKQCAAAYTYLACLAGKEKQIRVNCINPGITETPLSDSFRELLGQERYDSIVDQTGRSGKPDDVAAVVEMFTLMETEWLNGVEITVDGGYFGRIQAATLNAHEDRKA
ncbi:MAG: SDR family oxidoreductase [Gammaproteobacteria bacterium]|jgi:NAD(P)-dependent dehydrogenase (short-subunit alcohol dehydrogenase family)|nr:SDR family oxidoreductase [Gammaproteobacteria bacterium]MBT5205426.1 SDR family oxidoreductase [Gammaproteobacteria bacterium]MBT5601304.1 SDR family oxidoreductase [Gammaproteobacteria bacterium]MBT6244979.1 SDR family oxidoreductase [Gammaproteobacteria bacterium]